MSTPTIRLATVDDIPWLIQELRKFSEFFGTRKSLFPTDDNEASYLLERLVESQPFVIAENGVGPMGFMAGALEPHLFNAEIMTLTELFWWVTPEHRQSRAGAILFNWFIDLGNKHADWIVMTLEADSPVNPRTLGRRGFRLHERSYLLEVTTPRMVS